MKPAPFGYHSPETLDEAVALLGEFGDAAKPLAGGQSLVPMLALRLTSFEHLVDLGRVEELKGIARADAKVVIGAGTVDALVERDEEVARSAPLVSKVTPLIGHFQIRNRGTLGGSIAHADPAAEYPAVAVALDADMEAVSPSGRRTIPAAEFFEGTWTTVLEPDEILAAVHFPVWGGTAGYAVEEFARRHGDFALAGAVCAVELDGAGRVHRLAIGMLGLGPTPLRAVAVELALTGGVPSAGEIEEAGKLALADIEPPSDVHASAGYRSRVGAVLVSRAVTRAIEEARSAGEGGG